MVGILSFLTCRRNEFRSIFNGWGGGAYSAHVPTCCYARDGETNVHIYKHKLELDLIVGRLSFLACHRNEFRSILNRWAGGARSAHFPTW